MNDKALSEREVRAIVIAEIVSQLKPIVEKLDKTHAHGLALYSNGSGGPPGYLENAREEDNRRFSELAKFAEKADENDQTFKEFIKSYRVEREIRDGRRRRYIGFARWALPFIGTAALGLATALYHAAAPVITILWQDYLRAHPEVLREMKSGHYVGSMQTYAMDQDAGNSTRRP